ncbi:type II secretion system F family protein [Candidatus Daviesbacteria bacterium]|nr:type II secretion system F family protein [Candidatus Daviesbacteria bacterium]
MPTFVYKAKDRQGVLHSGTIETGDTRSAASLLGKKGLVVISVSAKSKGQNFFSKIFSHVSFSELVIMTRQLATMIQAGLVLSEALDILESQQDNKRFKEVLGEVSRDVKSGMDLASALRKHPQVFPTLYSNLIKAGESSGKLDTVLIQMAENLEKEREFQSRIRGAMIYPIMILVMMVVVIAIMMFFVIPRLTSLYSQSNIDLPLPTKILITTSNIFLGYWWLMIIIFVISLIIFRRWVKTPVGKYSFDVFLLKIPVVGKIITGAALTNFTRTFGLLISAGIPILDSLNLVTEVMSNGVYKKALEQCAQGVERGLTFSAQLEQQSIFPKIIPQMYRVGEETGKVDEISFKMAEYFETEADHLVKNLTVIIEPVILVMLGIGVAFLVLSIILPIYKLTTSFS